MAGERDFVEVERIVPLRRGRAAHVREASVELQPGQHNFRLSDLLDASFLPQIGPQRVVVIQGETAGVAIDNDGDIVDVSEPGVVRKTHSFVSDRDSVLLQNVVGVTLHIGTVIPPFPYANAVGTYSPVSQPAEPVASTIPLGKIKRVTVLSFPR